MIEIEILSVANNNASIETCAKFIGSEHDAQKELALYYIKKNHPIKNMGKLTHDIIDIKPNSRYYQQFKLKNNENNYLNINILITEPQKQTPETEQTEQTETHEKANEPA